MKIHCEARRHGAGPGLQPWARKASRPGPRGGRGRGGGPGPSSEPERGAALRALLTILEKEVVMGSDPEELGLASVTSSSCPLPVLGESGRRSRRKGWGRTGRAGSVRAPGALRPWGRPVCVWGRPPLPSA